MLALQTCPGMMAAGQWWRLHRLQACIPTPIGVHTLYTGSGVAYYTPQVLPARITNAGDAMAMLLSWAQFCGACPRILP